ncbi:RNA polymerase sigma factor [Streptomyces stramineus]
MSEKDGLLADRLAMDVDDGFAELVRLHASAVRMYLLRLSGSAADADDLGQDTFLRAYKALQSYSADRRRALRPRAWLMSIATNVWRNDVRAKSRRPVSAGRVEDSSDTWPDHRPGPGSARTPPPTEECWSARWPSCRRPTGSPWCCAMWWG